MARFSVVLVAISLPFAGCGGNADTSPLRYDMGVTFADQGTIADSYFADDPPPKHCGPDDSGTPPPPGGTPECPDDKNREGCACVGAGKTAACWPGLRVNRNRGICKDGQTKCLVFGEVNTRWGPCEGYVLPKPGATLGKEACACFSEGNWRLENLSPCILSYPNGDVFAVSSFIESGVAKCPEVKASEQPKPQPNTNWTINELTVDCAGQFELCYTIKAGAFGAPKPSDCVVAQTCTEGWYAKENVPQPFPALPSWLSGDTACAKKFRDGGGYGEMSVVGLSVQCEPIGNDTGGPTVFKRLSYCPLICESQPANPLCEGCGNDGDGTF